MHATGLYFEQDASYMFGLVVPLTSILLLSMTVLGLVLIGSVLANPLGPNRESFAVCHFVNYTCTSSLEAVSADRAPTLLRSFESGAEAPSAAAVVAGGSGGGNGGGNKLDANAIAEVKRMIAEERENLEKLTLQNVANRMSKGAAEAAAANWGSTTPAPAPSATSKWRVMQRDVVGKPKRRARFAQEEEEEEGRDKNRKEEPGEAAESAARRRLSAHQKMLDELEALNANPQQHHHQSGRHHASSNAPSGASFKRGKTEGGAAQRSSASLFDAHKEAEPHPAPGMLRRLVSHSSSARDSHASAAQEQQGAGSYRISAARIMPSMLRQSSSSRVPLRRQVSGAAPTRTSEP